MSITNFDNVIRSALWSSYSCSCFYCNKPLDWTDLHVDHIIPESIETKLNFDDVKIDYALDPSFQVNDLQNLVPTHAKCNQRKGDELFNKATTLYYLALTNRRLSNVEAEIAKLLRRKNKGQIIAKLQSALATGLINTLELAQLLESAQQNDWNTKAIKLPAGIEFIDEVYDLFYLNEDYSILLDKPILFGGVLDFVELINEKDETVKVSTLREWQKYTQNGFYPKTNTDIKLASEVTFLDELLDALKKASMPKASFISDPWINITDLDKLSPMIIQDFEGRLSEHINNGLSIGELVNRGIITRNESQLYQVSLELMGIETSLREVFRADFNGDGLEDVLVQGWVRAIGGSMGFSFTTVLTRYSNNHLLEVV